MKFVFCVLGSLVLIPVTTVWAELQDNRPEYQKEYDAYLKDLEVIAQTGKAPKNVNLEADLAKMSSNHKIRLTFKQPVKTNISKTERMDAKSIVLAQLARDDNVQAEIVHSVEIIRIPEEFRGEYADIEQEENGVFSAQEVAEIQNAMKKNMIKQKAVSKTALHINPFRFLKEVELSALPGEYGTKDLPLNPMVDAYFNQFGRPFTADAPAPTPETVVKKEEKKPAKSFLKSLSLRNSMFVN